MAYDIVGDVHGQADKLEAMLRRLGCRERGGVWVPPQGRQVLFVGDLIDRGPQQVATVRIVRSMIEASHARAVLGNHEFNAIGYATERPGVPDAFLYPHTPEHRRKHAAFLDQVGEGSALHQELVGWFRTLRPTLDLGALRVVHAWWHPPHVELVDALWPEGSSMSDAFLVAACDGSSPVWAAMEGLTKGKSIDLPPGCSFRDSGGHERLRARVRWWIERPRTYREAIVVEGGEMGDLPDCPLPAGYRGETVDGAPIFIGHYWMTGTPAPQSPTVACLDYSVAAQGPLVAYRWDGEEVLDGRRFVAVG